MSALADFDLFWPEPPFEVEVRDYGPCFTCPRCDDPECDALCGGDLAP